MAEEVRANQGTADQLPQGAATDLNDAMPSDLAPEELVAPEGGTPPETTGEAAAATEAVDMSEPELADQSDFEPQFVPENEDEAFIVGDTTRPGEALTTGAFSASRRGLPSDLAAAMPLFEEAANLPDAPPQMKFLLAALADLAES